MTWGEIMKLKKEGVNTMLAKIEFATYMTYWKIRHRLMKMANEEDGMETLETVILIGVAVIIAFIIYNVLTGGDAQNGENGMIGKLFSAIDKSIQKIFPEYNK